MSRPEVHAGFIPLTDCAPLAVAKEMRLDEAEGFSLVLHREASWANIRDKVEAGTLDCAIMLAPMPLAASLGLGGRRPVHMIVPMATSLNGNAITVSRALYSQMRDASREDAAAGGMAPARALARVVEARRLAGLEPLTFGMVYPFSCHNYDLRYFLAAGGVDPVNDANIAVVPPPLIAASLKSGRIDGFCVGEPWNSVAVANGDGVIIATKSELWSRSPEKVLGLREDFARGHPDLMQALLRTLLKACQWADQTENCRALATILSASTYVGTAPDILARALAPASLERGDPAIHPNASDMIIFHGEHANFPWVSHACWLLTQMIRWGQTRAPFDIAEAAASVYRPDIFRKAAASLGIEAPASDMKGEGEGTFFGTSVFDPADPLGYLCSLPMRRTDLAGFRS